MVKAVIYKKNGEYSGFLCKGHAGFAKIGSDIVCSAVSTLTINTVNSIEEFTDSHIIGEVSEGMLKCDFPEGLDDKGKLLMDSLMLGLNQIQKDYNKYFRLDVKEV